MTSTRTQPRRTYYRLTPRGFANEVTIFVTRRPKALEVALERGYAGMPDARWGRITYRTALHNIDSLAAYMPPWEYDEYDQQPTLATKLARAEAATDRMIDSYVADDDPDLDDLAAAVAAVTEAETALADALERRDETIRAAHAAGEALASIGSATGLSTQRIHQIVHYQAA